MLPYNISSMLGQLLVSFNSVNVHGKDIIKLNRLPENHMTQCDVKNYVITTSTRDTYMATVLLAFIYFFTGQSNIACVF